MINLEKKTTVKKTTINLAKDESKARKVTIRRDLSDFATPVGTGVSVIDMNALFASLRPEVLKSEFDALRG